MPASARGRPSSSARQFLRRVLEHRSDERPHHVAQERVCRDLEFQRVAAPVPGRGLDRAGEDLVRRLRRRERTEVVPAEHEVGALGQLLLVDLVRIPAGMVGLERRTGNPPVDPVAIGAGTRRVARMEIRRRLSASITATSSGSAALSAAAARSTGAPPWTSTEATCPSAWTPVSVRPATASEDQPEKTRSSASCSEPSTVRRPG